MSFVTHREKSESPLRAPCSPLPPLPCVYETWMCVITDGATDGETSGGGGGGRGVFIHTFKLSVLPIC